MGYGLLVGAGSGAFIGLASGDDESDGIKSGNNFSPPKAFIVGILLGGLGLVVGTIWGIESSTSDRFFEPLPDYDFSSLRMYSRYPQYAPEFLQNIK